MRFLKNLFGTGNKHTRLEITDSELGHFDSDFIKGSNVTWIGSVKLYDMDIELIMNGNHDGLFTKQKEIVLSALSNEEHLKTESSIALKEQYDNAEMDFSSIKKHFDIMAITTNNDGFVLSFEQKESPYYYFNVSFMNNKQNGVSIDS